MTLLHNLILSKLFGSSGGGGGGSGMESFPVTFTYTNNGWVCDKTYNEIATAKTSGKFVEGVCDTGSAYLYAILIVVSATGATFQRYDTSSGVALGWLSVLASDDSCIADLIPLAIEETEIAVSGATPEITPAAGNIYKCGTLTSLTVMSPPAAGHYVIIFTSGSTATTTTIPASVIFPEAFAAEANTRYEIDVQDGYAVVGKWAVS